VALGTVGLHVIDLVSAFQHWYSSAHSATITADFNDWIQSAEIALKGGDPYLPIFPGKPDQFLPSAQHNHYPPSLFLITAPPGTHP